MKHFLLFVLLAPLSVGGQELRVLSGGAAKSLVEPLAASFKGAAVKVDYQPMGRLVQTLASGEKVDLAIVTSEVLATLERDGRVQRGAKPIARVGIGVAVNEKAPLPDISTVEAFKRALLAAKSVVYIDPKVGTSGKHVAEVLSRLGIADAVNAKATLAQGGYIVEPVGRGEIELGIHQISEILPVPGIELVGPLPSEIQTFIVFTAAIPANAKEPTAAKALVDFLTSPRATSVLKSKGLEQS